MQSLAERMIYYAVMTGNHEASHTSEREEPPLLEKRQAGKYGIILILILLLFYLGLQNGKWVPISDGDIFLATARNIAAGQGFTFNNTPVRAFPAGWPVFLAGMMRISADFRFLNLVPMSLMLVAIFLYYRILLKLTTPGRAFAVCLIFGGISHVFHRTFLFHSEALFCLLTAGAVLLGLRANERPNSFVKIAVVLCLCALLVYVRWAAVLLAPLIAMVLLKGELKPKWNRVWIGAALAMVVIAGTFAGLRVQEDAAEPAIRKSGARRTYAANKHPIAEKLRSIPSRIPQFGAWYAAMLAEPVRLGRSVRVIHITASVIGFGMLAVIIFGMLPHLKRREWLPLGALLYSLGFAALWNNVSGRYIVPVLPFLILALWQGLERLWTEPASAVRRRVAVAAGIMLIVGTAACNLALYVSNVWLLHGRDFYSRYYAGQPRELINVAEVLNALAVEDDAVCREYAPSSESNASPTRGHLFDLRGLSLLISRSIGTTPRHLAGRGMTKDLLKWARSHGVKYYIHTPPVSPWRIWHFRAPGLQKWMTGQAPGALNPFYELYEVTDEGFVQIPLPDTDVMITRVPGL